MTSPCLLSPGLSMGSVPHRLSRYQELSPVRTFWILTLLPCQVSTTGLGAFLPSMVAR